MYLFFNGEGATFLPSPIPTLTTGKSARSRTRGPKEGPKEGIRRPQQAAVFRARSNPAPVPKGTLHLRTCARLRAHAAGSHLHVCTLFMLTLTRQAENTLCPPRSSSWDLSDLGYSPRATSELCIQPRLQNANEKTKEPRAARSRPLAGCTEDVVASRRLVRGPRLQPRLRRAQLRGARVRGAGEGEKWGCVLGGMLRRPRNNSPQSVPLSHLGRLWLCPGAGAGIAIAHAEVKSNFKPQATCAATCLARAALV